LGVCAVTATEYHGVGDTPVYPVPPENVGGDAAFNDTVPVVPTELTL